MDTGDHVFDAGSAASEPAPLYPLYTISGSVLDRSENLSCSSSSSFCYLCAFAGETGMSVDIRAHIRDLSKRGFELPAIARAVSKIYRRDIQPHVEHTRLDGTAVQSPEWSLESIHRHLSMGGEFSDSVFQDGIVRNIFSHLIIRLNQRVLTADGHVDEAARKALLDTIGEQTKWRRSLECASTSGNTAGKRKKK